MTRTHAALDALRRRAPRRRGRVPARDRARAHRHAAGRQRRPAERTAELLEATGLRRSSVIRCRRPRSRPRDSHRVTNLIVRHRFGDGADDRAQRARRRRAARRRLDEAAVRRRRRERAHVRARRRGVEVRHRDLHVRAARARGRGARAACGSRHGRAALHLRRGVRRRARARAGCCVTGSRSPTSRSAPGFSYAVVTAHNGCLQLEVTVHGKAAHAAMPESGVDALKAAHAILTALYAQRDRLRGASLEGGGHRLADDQRRPHRGRHQHQRRARPKVRPEARSAHDSRGGSRRGRGASSAR